MMFADKPVVTLNSVDVLQKDVVILSDVNFTIKRGEFVFLTGRTGSGKSSLLKTLYADLWLQKGHAEVADYVMERLKAAEIPFLRRKLA